MRPPHDEQRIGHVSKHIGAALNAANIVYDRDDFADPKLERLTPIQVTKDGRVFGHLAGWKSEHIGRPGVKPPRGTDYRYFHQGLVPTPDGDLAVGHLTLGTGHAGAGNINAAAEHYDNTGAQVAAVRVGEDAHGIWFAGRTHPTTDDLQRQTLRRSSLSGDWRKVNGQYELVAALAVNVPGFPIPRTESLVASGDDTMLVAAGMVRNGPITYDEVQAMVTAAGIDAQARVNRAIARERLRQRALPVLDEIVASARVQKRRELTASAHQIRRQQATDRYLSILAAGVDMSGRMPPELHRYWTKGPGLARWASTGTPYRSLVSALESEIADMSPEHIKGLAANLYHDVFKQWPGGKSKGGGAIAASAAPLPAERAQVWLDDPQVQALLAALPVPGADPEVVDEAEDEVEVETAPHTGGMIALLPVAPHALAVPGGEPENELHLTLVYLGDDLTETLPEWRTGVQTSVAAVVTEFGEMHGANGVEGAIMGRAAFNEGSDGSCAVYLVEADGLTVLRDKLYAALGDRAPAPTYDAFIPHITAGYGVDTAALYNSVGTPVQFDRVRIAIAGDVIDLPISEHVGEALLGEVQSDVPEVGDPDEAEDAVAAAGDKRKVKTQAGADKFGVSIGDVIGKGIDDAVDNANGAVDRAQADAANLGKSVAEALFGKRPEPKDAPPPAEPAPAAPPAPEPKRAAPEAAPAQIVEAPTPSRTYDETDAEPIENHAGEPETSTPSDVDVRVTSDVQPRMDVGAGTDHPMAEDEAPMTGAEGGELVEFGDGVATYSDGTQTDGTVWTRSPVLPGMGYDGVTLLEDQAPLKGAEGGDLVEFDGDRGVAVYSDGTETDGKQWTRSGQAPPVTASGSSVWQAITAAGRAR
ncbi:head maturation protease [Gordonia phage Rofo]|uniref:RNA ligase n=1 Tax=Gordonia phage Rofo TaxID=2250396 RepID=A0A345KU91_9CAUD|nr:head maturation protease [Gordonia phage Rofo]AXH46593.1 RNA ligase [Gordonia phage Rofo]